MSRPEFHKTEDGTKTTLIELNPGDCFESAVGYGCIVGQLTGGDALVEYIGAEKRQARVLGMTEVVKVSQEEFNRMQDRYARNVRKAANRLVGQYAHLAKTQKKD